MTHPVPKLKVFHLCQQDHPAEGGAYRVAQALVAEQRKRALDSRLVFLYGAKGHAALDFPCHYLGAKQGKARVEAYRGLSAIMRKEKPDLIHCHDGILWPRLALWPWRHRSIHHCHLDAGPRPGGRAWINRWVSIRAYARFLAISPWVEETWKHAGVDPDRIELIPNGVDCERFVPLHPEKSAELARWLFAKRPSGNRILLWVGRVDKPMKGAERLKRFIPDLPPDTSLAVVGDGPARAGLLEQFEDEIRSGKLVLPGAVDDPLPWYQAADAFLFTSHYEPFGLVLLEAAACGLPIVAFPVGRGGANELLKQLEAFTTASEEIGTAVHSIQNALTPESRREAKARVASIRKHHSWAARNQAVEMAYRRVLDQAGA